MADVTITCEPAHLHRHVLPDGRAIAYHVYGRADGRPVLALHGTPGSRIKFAFLDAAAGQRGLCVISPDRWAYGGSSGPRQASFSGFAADQAALMSGLGFAHFAVLGISGGGPYAAAVAGHEPARVSALALVSPVGEVLRGRVQPGLSTFHAFSFLLLPRIPGAIRATFSALRMSLRLAPDLTMRIADGRAGVADRAMMASAEARARVAAIYRAGLSPGAAGPALDMQLFSRRWDFYPAAITAPARLWIGDQDRNVSIERAVALARAIPGCELTVIGRAGHYWATHSHDEVLAWIANTAQR